MRRIRKIKLRNPYAVAARFRSSAGAMDFSKKSRKKEKELLKQQLREWEEEEREKYRC